MRKIQKAGQVLLHIRLLMPAILLLLLTTCYSTYHFGCTARADPAQKHVHGACSANKALKYRVTAVVTQVASHHCSVQHQGNSLKNTMTASVTKAWSKIQMELLLLQTKECYFKEIGILGSMITSVLRDTLMLVYLMQR